MKDNLQTNAISATNVSPLAADLGETCGIALWRKVKHMSLDSSRFAVQVEGGLPILHLRGERRRRRRMRAVNES